MKNKQFMISLSHLDQELYKLIPDSEPARVKEILIKQEKQIRFKSMNEFPIYAEKLQANDIVQLHQGLVFFKQCMSSGDIYISNEVLVDSLISFGIVAKVVEVIEQNKVPLLVYEAICIIFNITTGSQKQLDLILNDNVIKLLSTYLWQSEKYSELIIQKVVQTFGNIAAQGAKQRDSIIFQHFFEGIIKIAKELIYSKNQLFKDCMWAISVFCRKSNLKLDINIIKLLGDVIRQDETDIIGTAIFTLFSISQSPEKSYAKQIIEIGVIPRLVKLLTSESDEISEYSLKIIGLVASGTDEQLDYLLQFDLLSALEQLLNHKCHKRIIETLWVLSNITGGLGTQVKQVIQHDLIIKKLFQLVSTSKEESVVYESILVLSNALHCADNDDLGEGEKGFLKLLISQLDSKDSKLLIRVLEAIFSILEKGEKICKPDANFNCYKKDFEDLGGLGKIEQLKMHPDFKVCEKANNILITFYDVL